MRHATFFFCQSLTCWKHYNKQKGYVHIHDYGRDANGNPCRKTPGRDLSPAEMAKYGKLIERMKGSLK